MGLVVIRLSLWLKLIDRPMRDSGVSERHFSRVKTWASYFCMLAITNSAN